MTSTSSANSYIWYTWTSGTSSSTDTSTDTFTWSNWNTESSSTSTATCDTSWVAWNIQYRSTYTARLKSPYERGDEERRLKALRKKREEDKKVAEEKALQLLLDLIGEDQLKIYKETGRLFVKGNKYDYIVQKSGFIKRVEKDKITDLCVHLDNRYKYPDTDNVVALKLALETDEDVILNKANNHGSSKRPEKLPIAACM
jgi:hypothetical protein